MTTDLERELRVALHDRAAAITPERLRYAGAPRPGESRTERPRWVGVAPALAAACVAALALIVAVALGGSSPHPTGAGGRPADSLTGVIGMSWTLIEVESPNGTTTAIPPSLGASVTFLAERGRLELQDGVSAFETGYTVDADGELLVRGASGDINPYCGHDRAQLAAIAAIDAPVVSTLSPDPVHVRLDAGRLRVTANQYVLTLANPVRVAPSASPAPVPSGIETTAASAAPGPPC